MLLRVRNPRAVRTGRAGANDGCRRSPARPDRGVGGRDELAAEGGQTTSLRVETVIFCFHTWESDTVCVVSSSPLGVRTESREMTPREMVSTTVHFFPFFLLLQYTVLPRGRSQMPAFPLGVWLYVPLPLAQLDFSPFTLLICFASATVAVLTTRPDVIASTASAPIPRRRPDLFGEPIPATFGVNSGPMPRALVLDPDSE